MYDGNFKNRICLSFTEQCQCEPVTLSKISSDYSIGKFLESCNYFLLAIINLIIKLINLQDK